MPATIPGAAPSLVSSGLSDCYEGILCLMCFNCRKLILPSMKYFSRPTYEGMVCQNDSTGRVLFFFNFRNPILPSVKHRASQNTILATIKYVDSQNKPKTSDCTSNSKHQITLQIKKQQNTIKIYTKQALKGNK